VLHSPYRVLAGDSYPSRSKPESAHCQCWAEADFRREHCEPAEWGAAVQEWPCPTAPREFLTVTRGGETHVACHRFVQQTPACSIRPSSRNSAIYCAAVGCRERGSSVRRALASAVAAASMVTLLAGAGSGADASGGGSQRWTASFEDGEGAASWAVELSPDGSAVFVTGIMDSGSTSRFATVAYDASSGAQRWVAALPSGDSGEEGFGKVLAVSPDGSTVFVSGYLKCGPNCDGEPFRGFATVAYDASTGDRLWITRLRDGNGPESIDVSPDGSTVLVAGSHDGLTHIVAYEADTGGQRWYVKREQGSYGDEALAVSPGGGLVFVTDTAPGDHVACYSSGGFRTEAYEISDGSLAWSSNHKVIDGGTNCGAPMDLELSPDGATVYVAGRANTGDEDRGGTDTTGIVAYEALTGTRLWATRDDDIQMDTSATGSLAVGPEGSRVYAFGEDDACANYPRCPLATTAYDASTGERLWLSRYDSGGYAYAVDLGVSPEDSSVYVVGNQAMPCLAGCVFPEEAAPLVAYDAATGDEQWVTAYADTIAVAFAVGRDGSGLYLAGTLNSSVSASKPAVARAAQGTCNGGCGYSTARFNAGPGPGTSQDSDPALQYNGWRGFFHKTAVGGAYRASNVRGDTAVFRAPAVTSLSWLTHQGPDQGKARILVDGRRRGTFDLYSPTPSARTIRFDGLARKSHTVKVKVLGRKGPSSTGTWVAVDGFRFPALSGLAQENSTAVRFGPWAARSGPASSGGTWRMSEVRGAKVSFAFQGRTIKWITATGPTFGRARVIIDGTAHTVDLYRPRRSWRVPITFTGLSRGSHRITVRALDRKNRESRSANVVIDAFVVRR